MTYKLTASESITRISDGACIPPDTANSDYAAYLTWLAEGNAPEPAALPTQEEIVASFTVAIQQHLDAFAKTRGYDGILSACTYATSTNAKFAVEGQYCVNLRDQTWTKCYGILEEVQSATRPMPTLDEILAELPLLEWPI